jgi:hypothetical protein
VIKIDFGFDSNCEDFNCGCISIEYMQLKWYFKAARAVLATTEQPSAVASSSVDVKACKVNFPLKMAFL